MHLISARSLRDIERFVSGAEQWLTEFVGGLARDVDQPIVELTNDEADAD
jgi:hypothetical protein